MSAVRRTLVVFAECFPDDWPVTNRPVEDWARLARTIRARREHLGLSQDRVRELNGPSQPVQTQVETNDPSRARPRADSLRKYDKPLRWESGSTMAVLRGGDPTEVSIRPAFDITGVSVDELLAEVRRRIMSPPSEADHVAAILSSGGETGEAGQNELGLG